MLARPLLLLAAGTAAVLLVALAAESRSAAAGAAVGALTALSAVLAAHVAERRGLGIRPSLAIVVMGMLARMAFVAICTILALRLLGASPLPFAAALAVLVILGQGVEVWMLTRLRRAG